MIYAKDFVKYYDIFKEEKSYENAANKIAETITKNNAKTILDVGCGTGKIDFLLNQKGFEVTGIDNSKEMIEYAKKQYPKITFLQKDAENFKLNDKFDAIIALDSVLTFLTKENAFENALENIAKHLKPNGKLIFNISFTEKLIPKDFTDYNINKVQKGNATYTKESTVKREKNLLLSTIKIFENDEKIIEEEHIHRILSEPKVHNKLNELGFEVKLEGNSKGKEYKPLHIIATKK